MFERRPKPDQLGSPEIGSENLEVYREQTELKIIFKLSSQLRKKKSYVFYVYSEA